jgi:hypothetical protein
MRNIGSRVSGCLGCGSAAGPRAPVLSLPRRVAGSGLYLSMNLPVHPDRLVAAEPDGQRPGRLPAEDDAHNQERDVTTARITADESRPAVGPDHGEAAQYSELRRRVRHRQLHPGARHGAAARSRSHRRVSGADRPWMRCVENSPSHRLAVAHGWIALSSTDPRQRSALISRRARSKTPARGRQGQVKPASPSPRTDRALRAHSHQSRYQRKQPPQPQLSIEHTY